MLLTGLHASMRESAFDTALRVPVPPDAVGADWWAGQESGDNREGWEDSAASMSHAGGVAEQPIGEAAVEEDESVYLHENRVALNIAGLPVDNSNASCAGSLAVTDTRLVWIPENESQLDAAFSMRVRDIALHALARDADSFDQPCIVCQVLGHPPSRFENSHTNAGKAALAQSDGEDRGDDDADDVEPSFELRLIPSDDTRLHFVYDAITTVAELNPDTDVSDADEHVESAEEGGEDDSEGDDDVIDWDSKLVGHVPSGTDQDDDPV